MVGHEHVAVDVEAMSLATLLEELFKADAGRGLVEEGKAAVIAEGEEVEVAFLSVALQARRHASS